MLAVSAENLQKYYYKDTPRQIQAVNHVSLEIEQGEMVAIMGPSGSGKSTLLHLIGCLDRPTTGRLDVLGVNVLKCSEKRRAAMRSGDISFIFQELGLIMDRPVLENVMLPMYFSNMSLKEGKKAAINALDRVGLVNCANRKPSELSGGQRQRVAIARALAGSCKLLLADEPTGSLDQATGDDMMRFFQMLCYQGVTCVIVTHDSHMAQQTGRVITLKDGSVSGMYDNR